MKKWLLLQFIFYFFVLSADELKVGIELSYPPFEMVCTDGTPCGITVDIVKAFGEEIDRKIKIENISFTGLIPALQNQTIDMIASSLTITTARENVINFSEPYVTTGLALLLGKDSTVNNIEDANSEGKVIVVKSGTSGELYALKYLQKPTVLVLKQESSCILEVIQGKADAFIYDQLSIYTNWKKNEATTRVNLKAFQKEYWAFGIKKDNTKLLILANQFIKNFRENGGFEKLAEKYLSEEKAAFKALGVPFVF